MTVFIVLIGLLGCVVIATLFLSLFELSVVSIIEYVKSVRCVENARPGFCVRAGQYLHIESITPKTHELELIVDEVAYHEEVIDGIRNCTMTVTTRDVNTCIVLNDSPAYWLESVTGAVSNRPTWVFVSDSRKLREVYRGKSIGIVPKMPNPQRGFDIARVELLEVSMVSTPPDRNATIEVIGQIDQMLSCRLCGATPNQICRCSTDPSLEGCPF